MVTFKRVIMNKNETASPFIPMNTTEIKELTQEVKETVVENKKQFAVADLWSIQKQMKPATRFLKRWHSN
jgi:hypothetical protein